MGPSAYLCWEPSWPESPGPAHAQTPPGRACGTVLQGRGVSTHVLLESRWSTSSPFFLSVYWVFSESSPVKGHMTSYSFTGKETWQGGRKDRGHVVSKLLSELSPGCPCLP